MSTALRFNVVAPGTAAAQRFARKEHRVVFDQASARGPELELALPKSVFVLKSNGQVNSCKA